MLYSDSPIKDFDEDYLQQEKFVDHLKDILINYHSQESLVIQLRGEWGSGKSSILNMLKNSIENDDTEGLPLVMYFNPWNFSTKNELIKSFFEELSILFKENMDNDLIYSLNEYFNLVMSSFVLILPVLGGDILFTSMANFFLNISNWILRKNVKEKNLVDVKNNLSDLLIKNNRKILVMIDDIDRLTNSEIEQVFQLTKSIADFPNMIYILAYDEKFAIQALSHNGIYQPKEYIKKINQLQLDVPKPNKLNYKEIFFKKISEIFRENNINFDLEDIENIYYSYLINYFSTIRDINRFLNTLSFYLPLVKENICINDFLCLTILQVFEYDIYVKIRNNPEMFVESYDFSHFMGLHIPSIYFIHENSANDFYNELYKLSENEKMVKDLLNRLFPKIFFLENDKKFKFHDSEYIIDKRIASSRSFNYYFTFNNMDNIIPTDKFEGIISNLSFSTFNEIINDLKIKNYLLSFLDHLHLYNPTFSIFRIPFYIFIFLYCGDCLYCEDKTLFFNLELSLKISRFLSILLYNLEESTFNFSFTVLKDSLEKSNSLFLVMFVIYYFSVENDRDMRIFEDYHYDLGLKEVNILKQIAINKIIDITKCGDWGKVKNLIYVIDTYKLLIGEENENSFSFILFEYSSEENLIKFIQSLLSLDKNDENLVLKWEMLNDYLDTYSVGVIFNDHKKENTEFYRKNQIIIDKFLQILNHTIRKHEIN